MSKTVETHLTASVRTDFGKGAARRTRRDGQIPAVIYGSGTEPLHVAIPQHNLVMALRKHGRSAELKLAVDGRGDIDVVTTAVQVDPLRRVIEHVDFLVK